MSTIAFVTVAAGGNIPPFLAIGRALRARGHAVHVFGQSRLRDRFEAEGMQFTALRSVDFFGDRSKRISTTAAISAITRLTTSPAIRDEVADVLRRSHVDAALVDALMASSVRGGLSAGVPTAVLFHTYYGYFQAYHAGPLGLMARTRGVNMRRTWLAADRMLVVSDPKLDPGAETHREDGAAWLGAVEHGVASPVTEDAAPLVIASLSTTWFPGQTDVYQRIATALGSLPVRGLLTLGGVTPDHELTVPPNVKVRDHVSHAEVMPAASLVIGHGGHSTTFTALAHGKPLVLIPMHPLLDQRMVAQSVARAGAAVVVDKGARSDQIARSVQSLLSDAVATQAAEQIGLGMRETDAAAEAAAQLDDLVRGPRRVAAG
jgi:UDP:flavonoid glycosyltransferase YjiC (YdhE family)